jgi:hypothetical protein
MLMTTWYLVSLVGASLLGAGCHTLEPSRQEDLGQGIVRGTLGAQPVGNVRLSMPTDAISLLGHVTTIEGGAYVLQEVSGIERRVAHDENTRIDRPAHVGDRIEVFIDDRGRAILIRNIDRGE